MYMTHVGLECMQLWQCLTLCNAGSAYYCNFGSVFRGTCLVPLLLGTCLVPLLLLQVVLMNQVTTKVLDNNRGSKLVPALGEHAFLYVIITAPKLVLVMHVIAHKSTDWLQPLSVLVAVQATAGPMQPQAESSFTGKSRPDMHSYTNHLGCQQRLQSTMSLLMALEVDVHKKDQELEATCCVRNGHMQLRCMHAA